MEKSRKNLVGSHPRDKADLYALLVEELKDYAIFTMDLKNRITSWNAGARRVVGWEEEEAVGRPGSIVFTPEDVERGVVEKELAMAAADGRAEDRRWHLRRDGSRFWANGVMTALRGEAGEVIGFAKIMRDETERKRLEEEREQLLARAQAARAEAEAANRLKDEFLAMLSHELRSPLVPIVTFTDLLLRTPEVQQSPHLLRGAEMARRNALAQAQLIDDLLDLSRLRTGKFSLDRRIIPLASTVAEAVEAVRPQAAAKRLRLEVELPPRPMEVDGDPVRVKQIVWNLLNNAVKFTPQGGDIKLTLGREGDEAKLVVEDTGEGIEPEHLQHVFEMFRQADAKTARRHGGMGIGLALVRQFVELHGGRIEVASGGKGRGARFTVRLPLHLAKSHPALAASGAAGGKIPGLRVLVVDDSPDTAEVLSLLLELEGAVVATATSVTEALSLTERENFDLLLSDISMPEMDGFELLRELRGRPRTAKLPAIALTGFGQVGQTERALGSGFASYLVKPGGLYKLTEAILKAMQGPSQDAAESQPTSFANRPSEARRKRKDAPAAKAKTAKRGAQKAKRKQ